MRWFIILVISVVRAAEGFSLLEEDAQAGSTKGRGGGSPFYSLWFELSLHNRRPGGTVVSKDYAYGQGIQNEVLSPKLLGLT